MRRRIAAVISLPPRERVLLATAWAWLLAVDLALRFLPLSRVRRLLTRYAPSGRRSGGAAPVERLPRLIEIAARHHLYPMRCLQRALVLECWLVQRGHTASLQIGVRREGPRLWAHAWVEHGGSPIAERGKVSAFTPLLGAG